MRASARRLGWLAIVCGAIAFYCTAPWNHAHDSPLLWVVAGIAGFLSALFAAVWVLIRLALFALPVGKPTPIRVEEPYPWVGIGLCHLCRMNTEVACCISHRVFACKDCFESHKRESVAAGSQYTCTWATHQQFAADPVKKRA